MTSLDKRKSVLRFETSDLIRERGQLRPVCFEWADPYTCTVRLKGMRQSYPISAAAIYNLAVQKEVARQRAEKSEKKKGRRK